MIIKKSLKEELLNTLSEVESFAVDMRNDIEAHDSITNEENSARIITLCHKVGRLVSEVYTV
jgi:hypothetical protein